MRSCLYQSWNCAIIYSRSFRVVQISQSLRVTPHGIASHSRFQSRYSIVPFPIIVKRELVYDAQRHVFSTSNRDDSTIFALSTAPGRAAIAIVRVSGPACLRIYEAICPESPLPKARYATLRALYEPHRSFADRVVLDSGALVLYFPAPQTVTGEDVLEFHIHGGPAIVKAVLAAIPKSTPTANSASTIRYAEPGEFTRRAFYNNRLELTQIEALGDTLSAETEQQRRLAVRGTTSNLTKQYETWRHDLLHARGELEALIDFSEDQHFEESPAKLVSSVAQQVENLRRRIQANIENASRGELLRNGIKVALLGAPNAGKSSLMNRIVGRDAVIVSKEEGTTRDVIEVNVDIGGYFCKFLDLAGLRGSSSSDAIPLKQTVGEVEEEGIRRAKERVLTADVVIVVLSIEHNGMQSAEPHVYVSPEILNVVSKCDLTNTRIVGVINKLDLLDNAAELDTSAALGGLSDKLAAPFYLISCTLAQGDHDKALDAGGMQRFLNGLTSTFKEMTSATSLDNLPGSTPFEDCLGTTSRQRLLLQECNQCLGDFMSEVTSQNTGQSQESVDRGAEVDIVLAAEMLRAAATCLSKINGKGEAGDVEEVLGVVFEKHVISIYPCRLSSKNFLMVFLLICSYNVGFV